MAFDIAYEKTTTAILDPDSMRQTLGADGLLHDGGQFLIQAYQGLGPLISGPRCSPEVLLATDRITHSSIWLSVEYGAPTGALLIVPLTAAGAEACQSGAFTPLNPALSHVCAPGTAVYGFYGWLFAGKTSLARRRVVKGATRFCSGEFGAVPCFARAATAIGAATLIKLGFVLHGDCLDQYIKHPGPTP